MKITISSYDMSEYYFKVALCVFPNHTDNDIHSDHSYLDILGIPWNSTLKREMWPDARGKKHCRSLFQMIKISWKTVVWKTRIDPYLLERWPNMCFQYWCKVIRVTSLFLCTFIWGKQLTKSFISTRKYNKCLSIMSMSSRASGENKISELQPLLLTRVDRWAN